jgi:hypothetical protein
MIEAAAILGTLAWDLRPAALATFAWRGEFVPATGIFNAVEGA